MTCENNVGNCLFRTNTKKQNSLLRIQGIMGKVVLKLINWVNQIPILGEGFANLIMEVYFDNSF